MNIQNTQNLFFLLLLLSTVINYLILSSYKEISKITGIIEIPEEKIIYWQKYLTEILQEKIEPTSALSIAGLELYLQRNISEQNQKFLIIISGGNIEI